MNANHVTYTGFRDKIGHLEVWKQIDDAEPIFLPHRFDLAALSPEGYQCGKGCDGAAQLAIAITADVLGDDDGLGVYQKFRDAVVAKWPRDGFTITAAAVEEWAKSLEAKEEDEEAKN
jgi:hypothetical protein